MHDSMRTPALFSVIGLQNSGKTRFVLAILCTLRAHGMTAAVLKHDGHADLETDKKHNLDWEKQGSDTMLSIEAGALMTMVTGGGQSLLHYAEDPDTLDVYRLTQRMTRLAEEAGNPLDVIVVEGFKKSHLPKVFVCRTGDHVSWLNQHAIENIRAVIVPKELRNMAYQAWPMFYESQIEEILQACGVRPE